MLISICSHSSKKFQLTLPMRGAIIAASALCGREKISTHAPHAGSDPVISGDFSTALLFQLTLPMRGAISGMADYIAEIIFQLTLPMRGAIVRSLIGRG
ncbi:hypothetical protein D805_0630 [Bifidobacterium thermophilum RBL67]|uniref:Uncharacterized protein n=1 Tax=Bifidobacterium thermophilum RBL67 TaxID=1254439 RepID=M4RQT8_9BIFI|nr:hypothetical protein D805_0630 [Bifidobacterium thermophilum RBL67]